MSVFPHQPRAGRNGSSLPLSLLPPSLFRRRQHHVPPAYPLHPPPFSTSLALSSCVCVLVFPSSEIQFPNLLHPWGFDRRTDGRTEVVGWFASLSAPFFPPSPRLSLAGDENNRPRKRTSRNHTFPFSTQPPVVCGRADAVAASVAFPATAIPLYPTFSPRTEHTHLYCTLVR